MPNIINFPDNSNIVKIKVMKYFFFTIAISWFPIIAIYFLSFILNLEYKNILLYTSEISIMVIILSANNLKDLSEAYVLKKGNILFIILIASNVINMLFCLLFFAGFNSFELSDTTSALQPIWKQFWYVLISYFFAALMGLGVQIAGGIDQIKRTNRRR